MKPYTLDKEDIRKLERENAVLKERVEELEEDKLLLNERLDRSTGVIEKMLKMKEAGR